MQGMSDDRPQQVPDVCTILLWGKYMYMYMYGGKEFVVSSVVNFGYSRLGNICNFKIFRQ